MSYELEAKTGGKVEQFGVQLCIYSFPEEGWAEVRDTEIDAALDNLRKAMVAWADQARKEKLKAAL